MTCCDAKDKLASAARREGEVLGRCKRMQMRIDELESAISTAYRELDALRNALKRVSKEGVEMMSAPKRCRWHGMGHMDEDGRCEMCMAEDQAKAELIRLAAESTKEKAK